MNKTELNMDIINKVIAFKMLEIAHENGLIDDKKIYKYRTKKSSIRRKYCITK